MKILSSLHTPLLALTIILLAPVDIGASHVLKTARRQADDPCSVESYFQQTTDISPECVMRINSTLTPGQSFADTLRVGFCDPTCSPSYLNFVRSCLGAPLVEYYVLHCGTYNEVPCYSFLQDVDEDVDAPLSGVCSSAVINPSSCSMDCTTAVTNIRNTFGCCINNLFNTTYFRLAEPIKTRALNTEFWSECGVERPGFCPVDPVFRQYLTPETQSTEPGTGSARNIIFDKVLVYLLVVVACAACFYY